MSPLVNLEGLVEDLKLIFPQNIALNGFRAPRRQSLASLGQKEIDLKILINHNGAGGRSGIKVNFTNQ